MKHPEITFETNTFLTKYLINEIIPDEIELTILTGLNGRSKVDKNLMIDGVDIVEFVQDLEPFIQQFDFIIFPHSQVSGMHLKLLQAMEQGLIPIVHSRQMEWINADLPACFIEIDKVSVEAFGAHLHEVIDNLQRAKLDTLNFLQEKISETKQINRVKKILGEKNETGS